MQDILPCEKKTAIFATLLTTKCFIVEQKRIDYERFLWILNLIFYPVYLTLYVFQCYWTETSHMIGAVAGLSSMPLVSFLTIRLFSAIAKRKNKEVTTPRWMDLLIMYAIGLGGALPCLFFSARAYCITVVILTLLALFYVLMKKSRTRPALQS